MVHVLCINPFKSSVMFRIATSHLFCSAKQMVSIWNAILGWNGLKAFAIIHSRSTPDFECALNVAKTTLHLLENHSNFQDCNILECWFGVFQPFFRKQNMKFYLNSGKVTAVKCPVKRYPAFFMIGFLQQSLFYNRW